MPHIFKIFFIIEITLLVLIAFSIGLADTLIWIFATLCVGILFLRYAVKRMALHMIFGGILLIIPGYLSDGIGILLLLNFPLLGILGSLGILNGLQRFNGMQSHMFTSQFGQGFSQPHSKNPPNKAPQSGDIIDGEVINTDFSKDDN